MKHPIVIIAGLLVTLCTGCQSMPPPAPGMASIRIHVVAEPKVGARPPDDHSDYAPSTALDSGTGAFEHVDYAALDEIVVWLAPVMGRPGPSTAPPASIDVAAKSPAASLTRAVSVGQRVIVRNSGVQPAIFYSVSDGNDFDLGTVPPGGQSQFTVRSVGLIEILCSACKDPVAQVYAAPSQWVSLARSDSNVDFMNLPPGPYKLASWHPRLPGYEASVTLAANQISTATIKVGVNALPKVAPR